MNNSPLVSVLMTAYNREHYIIEAIESVLSSSYTNFELIIVDDCSMDATVSIVKEFEKKDSRLKLYVNEKNLGDYPNRNRAAGYAKGKYLKYLDSDDRLYPEGLKYCVECMEENAAADWAIIYPGKIDTEFLLKPTEAIEWHFFKDPFLKAGPGGTIIKKDFFFRIGMYPIVYGPASDMYFNLHAANQGKLLVIKDIFWFYRRHATQEQSNQYSYLYNYNKYLKDALVNLNLPLANEQVKWLQQKRKRRFSVNIINFFLKTRNFRKTREAIQKADFSLSDFISGIFHFGKMPGKNSTLAAFSSTIGKVSSNCKPAVDKKMNTDTLASGPLVSVCIPAYNCEEYIRETISSLLDQTYSNLEIIVVEDGSTDGTFAVLKSIDDSRLQYITQPNKGAAAARNRAFAISKGRFIKFMDADDLINAGCIEKQLSKIIDRPGCIASAKWGRFYKTDVSDFSLSPEKVWKDLAGIEWIIDSLIDSGGNMMQPGIFLIPRHVIDKAGPWNESLNLIDDFEYMIRVIANCKTVLFCDEATLMYRSGISNSLSRKKGLRHFLSALKALHLSIEKILAVQNDSRSRLACANTYQRWAFQFYPDHPELLKETEKRIKELGGSNLYMIGSKKYVLLSRLIGWKRAKKIRLLMTSNE